MKKKLRACVILGTIFLFILAALFLPPRTRRPLATSPDGRTRFIAVQCQSGTSFSTALGNRVEAWIRDALFDAGFRKIAKTSLKMSSPPNSHLFILEYASDSESEKSKIIRAKLIQKDGIEYDLITVGGGTYGLQKRQFAYWVLNGFPTLDPKESSLKVYLPETAPTELPLPTN